MKVFIKYSLLVLCLVSIVSGQVVQQIGTTGAVDWSNQVIKSTGIAGVNPNVPISAQRAGAIEAAKRIALRNAIETVKGMALNSEVTVQNAMTTNDEIRTKVDGFVRNFKTGDPRYLSDGSVEIDVEIAVKDISDIILPKLMGQMITPAAPGAVTPAPSPTGSYTGLVIDARGLNLRPAMAPKVVDETGKEIYGTSYVGRDYAVKIGVVGYSKDVDQASKSDRIGGSPLVIKGIKASGTPNGVDVVVSNNDAAIIGDTGRQFMEQCRVMFVID